jgi:arylsulfatase A-like enzyme
MCRAWAATWAFGALAGLAVATEDAERAPNLVLIFTDDQGWGDLGCQGASGFDTPHLDALAAQGVLCSNFYVSQPVCSASRAALLTGCYSNRVGISGALGPSSKIGIADAELTLAELSQRAGHATAIFGKWHLGHHPQFLPMRHGFDEFYGIPYSNDMWPFHPVSPKAWGDLPTLEGDEVVGLNTDQNRFTGDFTARAVSFIERHADEPFFLYLAHPMPHVPLHASKAHRGKSEQGLYGDVIEEIDASVGAVVAALERTGNTERTLVLYASDNGPWLSYGNHAGSTGPLREGKGTTFEGGVRVPCIWRWPGQLPAGRVCDTPLMTIDILPTWAGRLGQALGEAPIDGVDVWAALRGDSALPERALFFYYRNNELQAMRRGRWKLHLPHSYRSMKGRAVGADGKPGQYDYGWKTGLELYDLEADVGESTDLSKTHASKVEELLVDVIAMRAELGDSLTGKPGPQRRPPGRIPTER